MNKPEFLWTVITLMMEDNAYLVDILIYKMRTEFMEFYGITQENIDFYFKSRTPLLTDDHEEYEAWQKQLPLWRQHADMLDAAIEKCRNECKDCCEDQRYGVKQ